MPSPVGHGLAGLACAWASGGRRGGLGLAVTCAALAVLPDADLLLGGHRGPTHSLGAVLFVGLVVAAFSLVRGLPLVAVTAACSLAYASHLLLDWLGSDSTAPYGIQVFWPWSTSYYTSGVDLFRDISRRYWLLDSFILGNLRSIAWEMLVLGPVTWVAWKWRSPKKTDYGVRKTE